MIYSLRGLLIAVGDGYVVLECSGVGYRCFVTPRTRAALPGLGELVLLYTHLIVREDGWELYGFSDEGETANFALLLSVGGVGPKVALNILAELPGEKLRLAVASGDEHTLVSCQGVGKKLAQRIILELREKMGGLFLGAPAALSTSSARSEAQGSVAETMAALVSLGYTPSEAAAALSDADPTAETSVLLKTALRALAKKR